MRERDNKGRRRWKKALGTLESHYLILDTTIDDAKTKLNSDQTLPVCVNLVGKTAVVTAAARHDHTFGIQDIDRQMMLMWIRFEEAADYFAWKQVSGCVCVCGVICVYVCV